jgi:hypothetical protein
VKRVVQVRPNAFRAMGAVGLAYCMFPDDVDLASGLSDEERCALAEFVAKHLPDDREHAETACKFVDQVDGALKLFRCGALPAASRNAAKRKISLLRKAATALAEAWKRVEADAPLLAAVKDATGIGRRPRRYRNRTVDALDEPCPKEMFLREGLGRLSADLEFLLEVFHGCTVRKNPFGHACIFEIGLAWQDATRKVATLTRSDANNPSPFEQCIRLVISKAEIGDDVVRSAVAVATYKSTKNADGKRRRGG